MYTLQNLSQFRLHQLQEHLLNAFWIAIYKDKLIIKD